MYSAAFLIKRNADLFYKALKPEEAKSSRFSIKIDRSRGSARVCIEANDATAFKAVTTSMLKLIEITEKIDNGKQ